MFDFSASLKVRKIKTREIIIYYNASTRSDWLIFYEKEMDGSCATRRQVNSTDDSIAACKLQK